MMRLWYIIINCVMFKGNHEDQDYKKKREQHAVEIRNNRRDAIFSKKRNLNDQEFSIPSPQTIMQQKRGNKILIVDEKFREQIQKYIKKDYTMLNFKELVEAIHDQDILKQHYGMIGIRKIISIEQQPPIQQMIDIGLVPRLINYMQQSQYPQLQLQATWALTNIASGTTLQTQSIIDKGGIPLFIRLLSQNKSGIAEQAVWAIGNIAGDCSQYRDLILRSGGLEPLIRIVQNSLDKNLIKQGCWAISNLCRGTPLPKYDLVKASIPTLTKVLKNNLIQDMEVIGDICWALSYMTEGQKIKIQKVVESGVVPTIVKLTQHSTQSLIIPAVRILGNIVSGNQTQTDQVLKADGLVALEALLQHTKKTVRRQTCWVLSNIAAGTISQVNQVICRQSMIHKILRLFENDAQEVQKQICWIFANMVHLGDSLTIFNLYKQYSIIRYYLSLLSAQDSKTIETALQCLFTILSIGEKNKFGNKNPLVIDLYNFGAIDVIEKLQYHQSQTIYNRVVKILQKYFEIVDPLQM